MIVLGIDTATESVSVAVVDGDEVLAASESRSERRHAEDLTPMIDFVVRGSGVLLSEIDAIAVDVGPGLFTGMRVGIASAQASRTCCRCRSSASTAWRRSWRLRLIFLVTSSCRPSMLGVDKWRGRCIVLTNPAPGRCRVG